MVHPSAGGGDPAPVARLLAAGAVVVSVPVYTMTPVAPAADPVDAGVFGSPSAVTGWLLARSAGELTVVAAIGRTTAAALEAAGRPPDIVPSPPDIATVVADLVAAAHGAERTNP